MKQTECGGCVLDRAGRENSCIFLSVWLVNWATVKGKNVVPLKHIRESQRGVCHCQAESTVKINTKD